MADLIVKAITPIAPGRGWVLPVNLDVFRIDPLSLIHVLMVEFRHQQRRHRLRPNQQEKRTFQRLKAGPGEIVDAFERGNDEQIQAFSADALAKLRLALQVFLAFDLGGSESHGAPQSKRWLNENC